MRHILQPALSAAKLLEETTPRRVSIEVVGPRGVLQKAHQKQADMRYISLVFFLMTTLIFEVPAAMRCP
jgi:hypothetical protein